jgi:hypothetical protein
MGILCDGVVLASAADIALLVPAAIEAEETG